MTNLHILFPEYCLGALALLLMLADLWVSPRRGKALLHLGILFSALTLGALVFSSERAGLQGVGTMWVVDPLSLFFKAVVLIATALALLLTIDYDPKADLGGRSHKGTFTGLVLLSSLGMMLLVSAADLLLLFLSLELISITSFILSGFDSKNVRSQEGAMKYFLIGAFSSAVMIYGISLYYGAAGTTSLLVPTPVQPGTLLLAVLLIFVGFGFKASVVPFHLWVPDAYEGAPTPVTAYLSVAPKVAALAAMLRVFMRLLGPSLDMAAFFAYFAVLTMTVGNLTAIFQTNVKRLLAYSSIAQAGYMLIGFVAAESLGREALLLYALVYVFMNVGAFTVAIMVGNESSYDLESFAGLASRNFGIALLMAFFLLSLAGIPPLAGFIAKFYLFAAAVRGKWYWLAAAGLLNSVVSVFYYLRVVYWMFFKPARDARPLKAGAHLYSGLVVAALGIIVIGFYPDPFIAAAKACAGMLPSVPAQAGGAMVSVTSLP